MRKSKAVRNIYYFIHYFERHSLPSPGCYKLCKFFKKKNYCWSYPSPRSDASLFLPFGPCPHICNLQWFYFNVDHSLSLHSTLGMSETRVQVHLKRWPCLFLQMKGRGGRTVQLLLWTSQPTLPKILLQIIINRVGLWGAVKDQWEKEKRALD